MKNKGDFFYYLPKIPFDAQISYKGESIRVLIGEEYYIKNGEKIYHNMKSEFAMAGCGNSSLYVPLRWVAEIFNVPIVYDSNTKIITIDMP